jgi:hypothetical protein
MLCSRHFVITEKTKWVLKRGFDKTRFLEEITVVTLLWTDCKKVHIEMPDLMLLESDRHKLSDN